MSILDKAKLGNSVQVNLEQTKDRLDKDFIEAINISPIGIISDFRITDGKGIGVILKLSNGKEQWFFENEVDILDDNGNIIEKDIDKIENYSVNPEIFRNMQYKNEEKISSLFNPINFMVWLIVSLKDVI